MTTRSFTKTVAAALTVSMMSGAFVSTASASDRGFEVKPVKQHGRNAAIAGALLGIGGALVGAAIVHGQTRAAETRYRGHHDDEPRQYGYGRHRQVAVVEDDEDDCFDKPVKRFDRRSREMIVVGYKTVCR